MTRDDCSHDEMRALYLFTQKCHVDAINTLLGFADPRRLAPVWMVGLLRYTWSRHEQLSNWVGFRNRVEIELADRGMDPQKLLRNLRR